MRTLPRYLPAIVIASGAAALAFAFAILRDIRASDPGVQGAVVGALAGVIGAVAGAAVGAWNTRTADERRWQHEEQTRRRTQGEEGAREARKELLAAADLLSARVGAERSKPTPGHRGTRWEAPKREDIEVHTQRARDLALYIPEHRLASFIKMAVKSLENWDDANDGGAEEPWIMSELVANEVNEVFGAYGRGDDLPETPYVIKLVAAIDEWWDNLAQLEEEHQQRESERKRSGGPVDPRPRGESAE